ncbi:hypothetical protein RG963_15145, partial [Methanosarcina sp. Z-7115]
MDYKGDFCCSNYRRDYICDLSLKRHQLITGDGLKAKYRVFLNYLFPAAFKNAVQKQNFISCREKVISINILFLIK